MCLLLVMTSVYGKTAEEWKSRVIYQVYMYDIICDGVFYTEFACLLAISILSVCMFLRVYWASTVCIALHACTFVFNTPSTARCINLPNPNRSPFFFFCSCRVAYTL